MVTQELGYEETTEDIVEFADNNSFDEERVKKWEKANTTVGTALFLLIVSMISIFVINQVEPLGFIIPSEYYQPLYAATFLIFGFMAYLARKARRSTELTRDDMAVHYFNRAIISYANENYSETTENLFEFEGHAKMNAVTIFSDDSKQIISDYVDELDEEESNKNELDNSFKPFSKGIVDVLTSGERFESMLDEKEESNNNDDEAITTSGILLEGMKAIPISRFWASQILVVLGSLAIYFFVSADLGMFTLIAYQLISQGIGDRE